MANAKIKNKDFLEDIVRRRKVRRRINEKPFSATWAWFGVYEDRVKIITTPPWQENMDLEKPFSATWAWYGVGVYEDRVKIITTPPWQENMDLET